MYYDIQDLFTFKAPGYQFHPKFKSRMWDGNIRLFNLNTRQIYRGLVPKIEDFCRANNYDFIYEDEVYAPNVLLSDVEQYVKDLNLKIAPRDYQIKAFLHSIRNQRSIVLSPTASGKSLMLYLMARHNIDQDKRGIMIVPNVALVKQMTTDFKEYSELNGWNVDDNIHQIYEGQPKNTNKPMVISTWQSLFELPRDYFRQYNFVLGDECHGYKAKALMHIMSSLTNADFRIGVTGTLDGSLTNKMTLEGLFGTVYKATTTKELMDDKHVASLEIKALLLKYSPETCKLLKNFTYEQEIKFLIQNDARNNYIAKLALSLDGNTLVLFQFVEKHGKPLHKLIQGMAGPNRKVFYVSGEVDADVREEIRTIVETETNAIIVASYGSFSVGTNIKNLHNAIFASPAKSRIRTLQSIGRALRTSTTKSSAVLFDIADDLRHGKKENFTLKHFFERVKIYTEEKFKFKVYKIDLKGTLQK